MSSRYSSLSSDSVDVYNILMIFQAASNVLRKRRFSSFAAKFKGRPPVHLLVVLGSGGHTEEMISMLKHAKLNRERFARRTYVISSGDSFSTRKAVEFERQWFSKTDISQDGGEDTGETLSNAQDVPSSQAFEIVTIPRARKVHQSFWTAPFSTLSCLWACFLVLLGKHPDQQPRTSSTGPMGIFDYPDMILTNGPGTGVCVIVAARLLRIIDEVLSPIIDARQPTHEPHSHWSRCKMRTIFIESWARVTTLSLSGKILLPLVDRFLVQWEGLAGYSGRMGGKTEYVGTLLS